MKFCDQCGQIMKKEPLITGRVVFQCKCQRIEGGRDDTLMDFGQLETTDSTLQHEVFIDNSAFDPAANIVKKDCPECGLDYLRIIRVGINEVTMYTCTCGYRQGFQ